MPPARARLDVLKHVADAVPASTGADCVRVAVDGPDASGKTVFARELAAALRAKGRPVVRACMDDFHNPKAIRYRRGRSSPEGFWLDAFNLARFTSDVLDPLAPGGSRRWRPAAHDLASDRAVDVAYEIAPAGAVLIVDGLFLHRDELVHAWDFSIYLDVPFEVTAQRMAARDGTDPDPDDAGVRRYVQAQQIYRAACDPRGRAAVVIDNTSFDEPHLVQVS